MCPGWPGILDPSASPVPVPPQAEDPKLVQNQAPPTTRQAGYLKGIGVLRVEIYNLAEGLPAP